MKIIIILVLILLPVCSFSNELYRPPQLGDSGTYYVLSSRNIGNGIIVVLTSRIGKNNAYTDFTELKINCNTKQYFTLAGSSEDGPKDKPTKKLKDWSKGSKWTSLVKGSSKYDLVKFICKKYN